MKAAVYQGIESITIENIEKPTVSDGGAVIKVESCAICGSDIRIFHHGNPRVNPPRILGHELSGIIESVGKNCERFSIGDRVAVGADIPCGKCNMCESGHGNNCKKNNAMGYQFDGGFAEYCLLNDMVIDYGPVHVIPDNVEFDEAALAEPLACVINGMEMARVTPGDTVVIIGAGPIGCMMIPISRLYGAIKVIVIDIDASRIRTAEQFGADYYICSKVSDPVDEIKRLTNYRGADVVFTANAASSTHLDAIHMTGFRGRVNLFGGLADGSHISIDPNEIHYKEMSVLGSHGSTPRQHRFALEMISSKRIDVSRFITHRFKLDDINEAFMKAENKEGLRVIIKP